MKNQLESVAYSHPQESEAYSNRKLIRPSLAREHSRPAEGGPERRERPAGAKKTPPPEQTHAENFYYQKQMQAKTPMVVVTTDGEQLHGVIEWYDRNCIKLNRTGGESNLLIYKTCIKYMFKENEQD